MIVANFLTAPCHQYRNSNAISHPEIVVVIHVDHIEVKRMSRLQFPQRGNHVGAKMAVLPRVDPQFEGSVAREGAGHARLTCRHRLLSW
jgi:hypothetical protein